MHDLAVISKIQSIKPIEGRDRIVMAKVNNYNSIIAKDEFKENDTVIYVFYDSILPELPQYEFLRKSCYSPKCKGFRIRPMKMGGEVSEGLVLPLSLLPQDKEYKLGDVVTEELGIRHYDSEAEDLKLLHSNNNNKKKGLEAFLMKYKWFKKIKSKSFNKEYPSWVPKADEENIEKIYDSVKGMKGTFFVTEKIEGMAASYVYEKGELSCYSHNFRVKEGVWYDFAQEHNFKKLLKKICKKYNYARICIQGELIGPGIQRNIYKYPHHELFLYGGYYMEKEGDSYPLDFLSLNIISDILKIRLVPLIKRDSIKPLEVMLKECEGDSLLTNYNTPPREGLVWRTAEGDVHFKVKSRPYKLWWNSRDN